MNEGRSKDWKQNMNAKKLAGQPTNHLAKANNGSKKRDAVFHQEGSRELGGAKSKAQVGHSLTSSDTKIGMAKRHTLVGVVAGCFSAHCANVLQESALGGLGLVNSHDFLTSRP